MLGLFPDFASLHPGYGLLFRRGTKAVASSENTGSPRWLVPVLRACRMPHSGRFSDERSDSTSLAKLMVSPARTGLIQRSSRKPGDGPQAATFSRRAAASFP